MGRFTIAAIPIDINYEIDITLDDFITFSSCNNENPELQIYVRFCDSIIEPKGTTLIDQGVKWINSPYEDNTYTAYMKQGDNTVCSLTTSKEWRRVYLTYLNNGINHEDVISGTLAQIAFNNFILFFRGIIAHAAAIEWNGKGIIFSAPSGTGKSTQARLWKDQMGARVINGDRPALRLIDDEVFIYGTPWSGSSKDFLNIDAPLNAIVILEQSEKNTICKLSAQESVLYFLPRCLLPYQDSKLMNMAINNLENIINRTPVYLLKCRPDREAVELVYQCVK